MPRSQVGRRLAAAGLIDSMGTGMFLTVSAIYFTRIGALTPAEVAFGLSLGGLVGFAGLVPIGALADRFGAGPVYIVLQVWRGLGYGVYAFTSGFPSYLAVTSALGLGNGAAMSVSQAVVGVAVQSEDQVDTLAKIRAVRNVGYGLGTVVATAVLFQGSRAAFMALVVGNAASFLVCAAMLHGAGVGRLTTGRTTSRFRLIRDPHYLIAAVLNGVLSVHQVLLFVAMPLWIATRTDVPVFVVGVLVAINNVMCVTLQARFSVGSATLRGAARAMAQAGLALGACAVVLFAMGLVRAVPVAIALAILSAVLVTSGELWQSAGGWAISYRLARRERRGQYLATFQLGNSLQSMLGPTVVVAMVFRLQFGWLALAAAVVLAGLLVPPVATRSPMVGQRARAVDPNQSDSVA